MIAVVSIDENLGIGKDGKLLCRISSDMKHFRELTMGKDIVYGRKTLETFPEGKPLPKRRNLILTHNPEFRCDGAVICHSVDEVVKNVHNTEETAIIGGASVYEQFKDHIDTVYATEIKGKYKADSFFFSLNDWKQVNTTEWMEEDGICFRFTVYNKRQMFPVS